jgi:hypothetical protein
MAVKILRNKKQTQILDYLVTNWKLIFKLDEPPREFLDKVREITTDVQHFREGVRIDREVANE